MRNKVLTAVFLAAITAMVVWAAVGSAAPVESAPRTLNRNQDPIVVPGGKLVGAQGWTIGGARALASVGGKLEAIPFQIDEKRPNGQYALPFGDKKSADDGKIDANDELVFMAMDLGGKVGVEALPEGRDGAVEVEVRDPVGGGLGWVYLVHFAGEPPALSNKDYVSYNNQTATIDTTWFRMAFHPKALLSIGDLVRKAPIGGSGEDLVDRLKIRFTGRVLGMDLERDEENFLCRTIGWIDGPVRIVRRTINQVQMWKIKSPKALTDNVYYINAFEFPTIIELPFGSDRLVKNPKFRISTDGMCSVKGRRFFNSNNTGGVDIDGRMSPAEKSLDLGPYTWSVVTDPDSSGGWMNRLLYDETATPVRPNLYYVDNAAAADGPEEDPGECGDIGYTLDNLGELKKEKLYLKSILYSIPQNNAATISEFLNILDRPLQVKVTKLQ
jgi:hypothetical protein